MTRRAAKQQYSFTSGMLDDTLEARSDIRAYYAGAKEILNMLGMPQGGVAMRGGLSYVTEVPEAASGARMARFEFSTEQTYLVIFTDLEIRIYRDGVLQATVASPYSAAELPAIDWTQSLDTMILVHPDHAPRKLMRQGSHTAWVLENLSLTNVPQYKFSDGSLEEDVWSDTRGWPRSVYLFEGRLYFGGSKSRPQTVWGSSSNNFFDFKSSADLLDDEAVEMSLDGDRVSAVEQIYALDDLFAFTSGGLFVHGESPVTPENFYFQRHSEMPAANLRPVELDGSVVFVRRGADGHHQSVYELVYDDGRQIYTTQDLGLLAASLLRGPVDLAVRLGNESDSANHLFLVNGDGTAAVLNTRRSQKITGWTVMNTSGLLKNVAVVGRTAYFLVQRTVQGSARYYLERLDSNYRLDASLMLSAAAPSENWSGLEHLEGLEVDLIGDGADLGKAVVTGGAVNTPYPVSSLEVGLAYDWAVETMPLELQLADGTLVGRRHRIISATVRVQDTTALSINDRPVIFSRLGDGVLDQPPAHYSGLKTVHFLGWTGGRDGQGATLRMAGRSAERATLLSVTAEVGF